MKTLQYLFILFSLAMVGCEPMEDIYERIDEDQPVENVQMLDITLTDDDYSDIGGDPEKFSSFSANAPAIDFLPEFLNGVYFALDQGSAINVTYNYYTGSLNYLRDLTDLIFYELSNSDYDSFGGNVAKYNNFSSSDSPDDYLPDFLNGMYADSENGDQIMVTYKYYSGGVSTRSDYYDFNGTEWVKSDGVDLPEGVEVYTLNNDDYDSMGSGPGKYNNFSSSALPENYLPTFLGLKFPYAVIGDKYVVLYKYYEGEVKTKAKEYTKTEEGWGESSATITKTDQYIKISTGWIFDPTVLYTIEKEDFQVIVDYVKATYGEEFIDSYGTAEFYFGAGSHFENFDTRDGKYNKDKFASWEEAVAQGLVEAFLPSKFPDAKKELEGTTIYYVVTFATYSGVSGEYSMKFEVTKEGPGAEFKYIEGSLK